MTEDEKLATISFWDVQRFIQERCIHFHDLMLLKYEIEKRIHSKKDVKMPHRREDDCPH